MTPEQRKTEGYREVKCCETCLHCFIKSDYDELNEYYCTLLAPKRPPCGSCGMKEYYNTCEGITDEMSEIEVKAHIEKREVIALRRYKAWHKWADQHHVIPYYVCSKYLKREPMKRS